MLDAERTDRHLAGLRSQEHVHAHDAVLLAAADDLSRLDEQLMVAGEVLDRQLIDAAGLQDAGLALLERFLERQELPALEEVTTVYQIHSKVRVGRRLGHHPVSMPRLRERRRSCTRRRTRLLRGGILRAGRHEGGQSEQQLE